MRLLGPTAALVVSTAVLVVIENRIFPTAGFVGHDFRYFMPYLLAGVQWIHINGWSTVPYFTPQFCGGMPWLANPQSIFYSVPQAFSLITDFISAVKLTTFTFATVGALGTYALLRQCFRTSWHAAALGSVLFQLNGFLLFRMSVGHLTYHVFGLLPIIAWSVLYFSEPIRGNLRYLASVSYSIVITGCLFALMVYGGATNYIIPAILTVTAIILLHQTVSGWHWSPWVILGGGAVWSLFLSALKLVSAFVFASYYPRTYLHDYLFANPLRMTWYLFRSLFMPETLPFFINMSREGSFGLHELEFGVSLVPALLIAAALLCCMKTIKRPNHPFITLMLSLIFAIPFIVTIGPEAWGRLLEHVPIINNNTTLTRWYSIYIVPLIILSALSFDRIVYREKIANFMLIACILLASLQFLSRDLSYYTTNKAWPLYNPAPVSAEARRILSGGLPKPITDIGPAPAATPSAEMDALLLGRSALPCYEALFGYHLEMFPARQLRPGPITDVVAADSINMADPRCYLTQNSCAPGHLFRSGDKSDALAFAAYQPLRWHKPVWQKVAEWATLISLTVSATVVLAFVLVRLLSFCRYLLAK